jgi:hypothetical protein
MRRISARTGTTGVTIATTVIIARTIAPIITDAPPTTGHILIKYRRRSSSASGLGRRGGEEEFSRRLFAFIFAVNAFMTRSRGRL